MQSPVHQMLYAVVACLLLPAFAHSDEHACVEADPPSTEAFTALAKQHAAQHMDVASRDVLVFRVLDCGTTVDVLAFQRNRLINWEFIFDRASKNLLKVKSEEG